MKRQMYSYLRRGRMLSAVIETGSAKGAQRGGCVLSKVSRRVGLRWARMATDPDDGPRRWSAPYLPSCSPLTCSAFPFPQYSSSDLFIVFIFIYLECECSYRDLCLVHWMHFGARIFWLIEGAGYVEWINEEKYK